MWNDYDILVASMLLHHSEPWSREAPLRICLQVEYVAQSAFTQCALLCE